MKLIEALLERVCIWISKRCQLRRITREDSTPYLDRYYLFGDPGALKYFPEDQRELRGIQKLLTRLPCVYLHHFRASDSDDFPHNHPWCATSLILIGGYRETRLVDGFQNKVFSSRDYLPGQINRLTEDTFHRVDLFGDERPCWTLLVLGKKVQSWGFQNPKTGEFVGWREHAARKAARVNAQGGDA